MFSRLRTRTNPVFYADQLRLALSDEPERVERAFTDPRSLDLLTWNFFASLDTHRDRDWLAYRLQALGGSAVKAPVRMSLFSGRHTEPRLRSSAAYLEHIRAGSRDGSLREFADPLEVPVRIETPDVLVLVDTTWDRVPRGNDGRDRLVELMDAGLDHARRIGRRLAVAMVAAGGSSAADEVSHRLNQLRDPDALAAELPWRDTVPPVVLRELSWQELIRLWLPERRWMELGSQPVRGFLDHLRELGLR